MTTFKSTILAVALLIVTAAIVYAQNPMLLRWDKAAPFSEPEEELYGVQGGGKMYGRRISSTSFAAMPLRSPARLPSDCFRRSVLPPRKKNLPLKSFAVGLE